MGPNSFIVFMVVGLIFAVAGIVFESKKSWKESRRVGPRNGLILFFTFLALVTWFMVGIVVSNFGYHGNVTYTQIKAASPSLVFGMIIFFIAVFLKKKYLFKRQLL